MIRLLSFLLLFVSCSHFLGCSHGGHGAHHRDAHGPREFNTYIARLESPKRVEALQVARVIEKLELEASDTVADIGSGPGVFSLPVAEALESGLVYAVEVEPKQLEALRSRLSATSLRNVVPVLASFDDPYLPPGRIDVILVVDTYHHIDERIAYFERVKRSLAPGGRLAILEWKAGDLGMGPPPEHKLAPGVRERELRDAGYKRSHRFDFHELHDFEIWEPNAD